MTLTLMVYVYAVRFNAEVHQKLIERYAKHLPDRLLEKLHAFRHDRDAQLFLLGKVLLMNCLYDWGYTSIKLENIRYNKFDRPYFLDGPDFNISHSGDYVVCAVGEKCRVGIDIEEIREIDIHNFRSLCSDKEWNLIGGSNDKSLSFFKFWTRKEAVIKGDGIGLQIELNTIEVIEDCITLDQRIWHLRELPFINGYVIHIATDAIVNVTLLFNSCELTSCRYNGAFARF